MKKQLTRWLAVLMGVTVLAACGGGSPGGTATADPSQPVGTVEVASSQPDLASGSSTVVITARVKDTSGKLMSGQAVTFFTNSGVLTEVAVSTDSLGVATAQLGSGSDLSARIATVTVTASGKSNSVDVNITGPLAAAVDVISSSPEVLTGGTPITVSAVVKDQANAAIPGAKVSFSSDTGLLTDAAAVTDASGVATAKFSGSSDKSNRPATVTVTSGAKFGSVTVSIAGTKVQVTGPTTLQINSTSTVSAKLTDGTGSPIPNVQLAASSVLGNLSAASVTTDAQGAASLAYNASNAGTDSVKFTGAGSISVPLQVIVSAQDFSFVSPALGTTVPVGSSQLLTVRYRVNNIAQAGVFVNFNSTAGQLSATSGITDANGEVTVSISASTASPAIVQASFTAGGTSASATVPIEFVATTPSRLVLQITPTAIPPNQSGSTTNQAQIVARVTDANGNPVKNQTVNFSRDLDLSGGNLPQPSALTDSGGQATVQYVSGLTSTASDGVVLRGAVPGTAVAGTAKLTVNSAALFIALGTGNTITNLDAETYQKDYTVYVTDANGVAVPNVTLTIKALPTRYRKGRLAFNVDAAVWGAVEVQEGAGPGQLDALGNLRAGQLISCANEDIFHGESDTSSFNGTLDADEDRNLNGQLEPGNVISVSPGTLRTDIAGRAKISLIYAESYVPWIELRLQVQAIVSGTESSTRSTFVVSGLAADFTDQGEPPAGVDSPYGNAPRCSKAGSYP